MVATINNDYDRVPRGTIRDTIIYLRLVIIMKSSTSTPGFVFVECAHRGRRHDTISVLRSICSAFRNNSNNANGGGYDAPRAKPIDYLSNVHASYWRCVKYVRTYFFAFSLRRNKIFYVRPERDGIHLLCCAASRECTRINIRTQ